MTEKPPTLVELVRIKALEFRAHLSRTEIIVDSAGVAGPSPVELLTAALAGCMSVDVADILTRGRHPLRGLRSRLTAERTDDPPRKIVRVLLHFTVEGAVSRGVIDRAIALSREKYCSVWHSMRQDIDFQVTFDVVS